MPVFPLHFNPEFETMNPAALRRIEEDKFLRQMAYVYERGPFYRRKFEEAGVHPATLRGLDDIRRIPFTEKDELRASQAESPPFGDYLCASREQLIRIHATSGTTGRPLIVPLTRNDIRMQNEVGARAIWAMGGRPGDIALECASYTLFVGGVSDHMCAETAGVAMVPIGFGNSKLVIEMALLLKATSIGTIPSYMDHLAEVARAEFKMDPRDVGLKKGIFGGEPGNLRHIEEVWGIDARDYYGLSEVACGFGGDCDYKQGIHFQGQGHIYCELIDPTSGDALEIKEGAIGELVFTNLDREACPMVRFRTHDVAQVLGTECECGRVGFRFKILGRSDDMLIVRGVNVFPVAIRDVLLSFQPRLSGNLRIVLDQPGHQISKPLHIKAELGQDLPAEARAELIGAVQEALKSRLHFRAQVELLPPGALEEKTGITGKLDFFERTYQA